MLQMTVRTKEDHQNYHLSVHMHATPWTIRIRSLLILVQRQGIHLLSQNCSMRSGCCYYPLPLVEMNLTKMLLRKMPRQLLWYSDWRIDWTMQRWQHWAMFGRQAAKLSQTHEKLGVKNKQHLIQEGVLT